jgi:hypothetical protein
MICVHSCQNANLVLYLRETPDEDQGHFLPRCYYDCLSEYVMPVTYVTRTEEGIQDGEADEKRERKDGSGIPRASLQYPAGGNTAYDEKLEEKGKKG